MGELSIMSQKDGDLKVAWDAATADEVSMARKAFAAARDKGYAAFKVSGSNWKQGEQIREFDATAERILMVPPVAGG